MIKSLPVTHCVGAGAEWQLYAIDVFLCPSDIPHLHYVAEAMGKVIPALQLRYVVTAEPVPEPVRMSLQEKAGVPVVIFIRI